MSTNNNATICGNLDTCIVYDHESHGKSIYRGRVSVIRKSGNSDTFDVLFPESYLSTWEEKDKYVVNNLQSPTPLDEPAPIYFKGEIRTHNQTDETGKNRLLIYLYATEILPEYSEHTNDVALIGFICSNPNLRSTPKGKTVADFMLAVPRDTPNRTDYVPCIAWANNAHIVSKYEIGSRVCVHGRFQSREYTKDEVTRTAYELSISGVQKL